MFRPGAISLVSELCQLGKSDVGKVKLFLLPSSMCPSSVLFFPSSPVVYWKLCSGLLDSHKGTFFHGWLSKLVFFGRKFLFHSVADVTLCVWVLSLFYILLVILYILLFLKTLYVYMLILFFPYLYFI